MGASSDQRKGSGGVAGLGEAVLSGIVSGLAGGVIGGVMWSRWYINRNVGAKVSGSGQATATSQGQVATASDGSLIATVGRGDVYQHTTRDQPASPADLFGTVVPRHTEDGFRQSLRVINSGVLPAESLKICTTPDGGHFIKQPDWRELPTRLGPGAAVEAACATNGAGVVWIVAQFSSGGISVGPKIISVSHQLS